MSGHHSHPVRLLLTTLAAAAIAGVMGLGAALELAPNAGRATVLPATHTQAVPDSLEFEVEYAGIGREGVDLVWHGRVGGAVPGQVAVRVEYAGPAADRSAPIWPINALLLFSADDYRSSFAAELSGSMNWKSGEMRVTGSVTDGARLGSLLEQQMRVRRPGYAGSSIVRFMPQLARRSSGGGSR